jgi:hypothetical protein
MQVLSPHLEVTMSGNGFRGAFDLSKLAPPIDPAESELQDLNDSEYNAAVDLITEIRERFFDKPVDQKNMMALVTEVDERFREELGLIVTFTLGRRIHKMLGVPSPNGTPELMTFYVRARTPDNPFDPEKYADEIKRGVADDLWERRRQQASKARRARFDESQQQGGHDHAH